MILKKKIYFKHSENLMKNEGDILSSRKYFFKKKNKNLYYLLKNRFYWMNNFINENDNMLELGSGPALLKEFILNKNFKTSDLTNYDFIDYKNLDATNTNLQSESFSVIISSNLIHHVAYPLKLFEEVLRLLKPGGLYIIQDVNCSLIFQIIVLLMRIEGFDFTSDVLNKNVPCNDHSDQFSGNNAIPNLIFDDFDKFNAKLNNKFEITYSKHSEFLSFINSGGVIAKTFYIPLNDFLNELVIKIDNLITKLDKIFAMQKCIVLKKIK